ncbi:MAG: ABC transporter ATP-binding protein [Myxococcales bacterium]|nr:ABC transporter ATP-binding protein [Myxococcales bacterium]
MTPLSPPRLAVSGATVTLGGRVIVGPITLEATPGLALVVVGPNGAGKSTLLSLLAGVRSPSSGDVVLGDRPLATVPPRERARTIAYLPQGTRFDFPYSVADVVSMGRFPHGDEHTATGRNAVAAAIDAMQLGDLRHRRVDTLSGGEQQRVVLARTLAVQAPIWLLDEPMTGLDLEVMVLVRGQIAAHVAAGGTVALSHHALSEVSELGRRVAVIEGGQLAVEGTPDEVLTPARLEATFRVAAARAPGWHFDSLRR